MDLVEAEGLADLLDARTAAQRLLALNHLSGHASSQFEAWRRQLLQIRASLEAAVDFSEEEGVAAEATLHADRALKELVLELEEALAGYKNAEVIRDGVRVVLAGAPNTGKSSLLNAIAKREAAIVSSIPGTTRDVIEVFLDLDGIPVILTDTAGLRDAVSDEIEREGIRRSNQRIADAQIIVWVSAFDVPNSDCVPPGIEPHLRVANKSDVTPLEQGLNRNESDRYYRVSAVDGSGIQDVVRSLAEICEACFASGIEASVTSERQRTAITESIRILNDSYQAEALELKAEDVSRAAQAIGRITGQTMWRNGWVRSSPGSVSGSDLFHVKPRPL